MRITINGTEKSITPGQTVLQILKDLNLSENQVVAELNREILTRDQFSDTKLKAGDTLELVQFVGGG